MSYIYGFSWGSAFVKMNHVPIDDVHVLLPCSTASSHVFTTPARRFPVPTTTGLCHCFLQFMVVNANEAVSYHTHLKACLCLCIASCCWHQDYFPVAVRKTNLWCHHHCMKMSGMLPHAIVKYSFHRELSMHLHQYCWSAWSDVVLAVRGVYQSCNALSGSSRMCLCMCCQCWTSKCNYWFDDSQSVSKVSSSPPDAACSY